MWWEEVKVVHTIFVKLPLLIPYCVFVVSSFNFNIHIKKWFFPNEDIGNL